MKATSTPTRAQAEGGAPTETRDSMARQLGTWALACGALSVAFYLLHDVIGAAHYPGYDWTSQAVSDLTATDAPSFAVACGYSSVYGILSCLCCASLCVLVTGMRRDLRWGVRLYATMQAISAVGYSLFPLTGSGYDGSPQSFIHVYVVTALVVLLSIVSLTLIARGSLKDGNRVLGILALVALLGMSVGAVGSANVPPSVFGIVERLSTYSAVVFTAVLGFAGRQWASR